MPDIQLSSALGDRPLVAVVRIGVGDDPGIREWRPLEVTPTISSRTGKRAKIIATVNQSTMVAKPLFNRILLMTE
jgi:hypothetical protein